VKAFELGDNIFNVLENKTLRPRGVLALTRTALARLFYRWVLVYEVRPNAFI
jgi:hypothetical protein